MTSPASASPPATPQRNQRCAGRRQWVLLWVAVAVLEALLLANNAALDTFLWRTTRWVMGDQDAYTWQAEKDRHAGNAAAPFYERIDPPLTRARADGRLEARIYKRTEGLWRVLRDLGDPYVTLLLLLAVGIYHAWRWRASAALLAGTVAAGGLGALIRIIAGRLRPNGEITATLQNDGGNYWQLFRGFHTGSDLSFPSGHATLAFATAAVLTYLSPRGRWLFVAVAAGCAFSRVVMQAHFYGDVLFGAAFGWTVGWWVAAVVNRATCSGSRTKV